MSIRRASFSILWGFLLVSAPVIAAARRAGLGFEIPAPEAPAVPGAAPGMDPARPPKRR